MGYKLDFQQVDFRPGWCCCCCCRNSAGLVAELNKCVEKDLR